MLLLCPLLIVVSGNSSLVIFVNLMVGSLSFYFLITAFSFLPTRHFHRCDCSCENVNHHTIIQYSTVW